MRRFIITHPSLSGKIEAHYNGDAILRKIDLSGATLTGDQVKWFKANITVMADNLIPHMEAQKVLVTEADFEVTVEDFLREYPYARNTHLVREYWPKMTTVDQYRAFLGASEYRQYLLRNTWQKAKIAAKWLKDKEYLNEWRKL